MKKQNRLAYLVIAHGTRDAEGEKAFFHFIEEFRAALPERRIEPAFLELCRPAIPEGIEACVRGGAEEIFILPLMLFPGKHVKEDIPREIQEAKGRYPHVDFHYSGALALNRGAAGKISEPKVFELLLQKIGRLQGATESA